MPTVPMSHPATAQKNSDGTWSVRIQHTVEGSITTVEFTNTLFAEILAKAYADVLNGKAAVEAKLGQIATDLGPAVTDAKADVKQVIADAHDEAEKLVNAAKVEAGKIKADAVALGKSAETEAATLKTEAGKLLTAAKDEAEKLLAEARTEAAKILHTAAAKVEPPPAPDAPVKGTPIAAATEAPKPRS
jgi:vacuolar-type H+-ATPase subunit H